MTEDVPLGLLIGLLVLLLLLSGFFSGTETALMTVNRYRLRHKAKQGHTAARLVLKMLERPDLLISLILLGNNLVNLLAASIATVVAVRLMGPAGVIAASFILTPFVLIFAEVTPKTLAALRPERVALPAAFVYYPLLFIARPFIWVVSQAANLLLRLLGVSPEEREEQNLTIEELRTLVAEAGALLPRRRQRMLIGVLELEQVTVDDVMVPHNEIEGIDLEEPLEQIMRTIRGGTHTRFPVYRGTIDNVVGVLHVRRLIQRGGLDRLTIEELENLVQEASFVPEGTSLHRQLLQFQRTGDRTAFVVDEYGDLQGIVTLEDILEEILGEFSSAAGSDYPEIRREGNTDSYVVDAGISIRALNRVLRWHLPTNGPRTLNGLILERLEAIPSVGTSVELNGYPAVILETSGNVVRRVRISQPEERHVTAD